MADDQSGASAADASPPIDPAVASSDAPAAPSSTDAPRPAQAPQEPVSEEKPYTEADLDADLGAIYAKHNPPKDPTTGKFVGKDGMSTANNPTVPPDQAQTKADEPQKPAAIDMPQSWSADRKAVWDQLPSQAKEFISQREQEAHKAISRMGEQVKAYEPLAEVFERYSDVFEKHGVDEATGVARLLDASKRLDENPVAAIAWLAQSYGVDLRQAAGLVPSGHASPDTAALIQQNQFLASQLAEIRNRIDGREQAEAQTQLSTVENQISDFAKDKPDWAELEDDIYGEILGLKAAIAAGTKPQMDHQSLLKLAYDRAQWNNPAARSKRQEADRKAEEKRRIEEAQKRTLDARKSAPLNVRTSPANQAVKTTMDDDLRAIAKKHYG